MLAINLLIITNCCFATDDPPLSSSFRGATEFVKDDVSGTMAQTKEVIDDIFYSGTLNPTIANPANDKITNVVSLLVREDMIMYIPSDFTAKVNIKIDYTLVNGTTGSVNSTFLEVTYTKAGGVKYNARQTIKFDQCRKVKVTIIDVPYKSVAWDVWAVLELENRMLRKRDYVFNYDQVLTPSFPGGEIVVDELPITWPANAEIANGKTHIDIEWTWVDEEALEEYKKNNGGTMDFDADLLFRNNSSRVTISANKNTFRIPALYDGGGNLFYRIRPVQYLESGQVINGKWSAVGFDGITYFTQTSGHSAEQLNWQRTTSFAEEGKNKTVMQYFDGTLRGRQTVTKDNVTRKTVVAETFYDYQGRPAVNILPTPTLNSVISYTKDFNVFDGDPATPKDAFDLMPANNTFCDYQTPPLQFNTLSGAARYYSAANSEVNDGLNKYIPNAQGYPFVQTLYTQDATGRIASQGGVGPVFQLNSIQKADTKYFYGKPDQLELDALFGTEAGDASHYSKNMVRDPNGQYSVSYVDAHGRTVATALAGIPPVSVKPLDSYITTPIRVERELLTTTNNIKDGRSLISTTSLVVPQEDLFQFKYRMSAKDLEMNNCDDEKICYDCYYDLEIRISGGCITPIVEKRTNLTFSNPGNVPNVDLDCLTSASAITAEFDVTLPEGEYDVVKILTVSKRAQDHYRENIFLQNNICKTLQEFIDERTPVMQAQFPCNITCASCTTSLGTYQQYRSAFLTQQGINPLTTVSYENEIKASYDEGMKACDALCKGADNVVASIENAMLDDMTPDEGQYARLDLDLDDDNIINPGEPFNDDYGRYEKYSNRPWNIFNADRYKSPLVQYHNEYGEVEPISVKAFTPQELADNFKAAWAKDLLPLHPEYNKLQKVKQLLLPSYSYDKILRETNTWTEANNNHFIEEVISTGSGTGIVTADPFFSLLPAYSITIKKYIGVDFDVYPNPTPKSLWSMAWMAVMCNSSNT
ncbi:hypothetical protein EGI32_10890, partial [Ferruginibacter sp. HRS2-29]|nr:hypothetical protein [Ferruginibacter sp. HRS2-29]